MSSTRVDFGSYSSSGTQVPEIYATSRVQRAILRPVATSYLPDGSGRRRITTAAIPEVVFPFGPQGVAHQELTPSIEEVERPTLPSLLSIEKRSLRTLTFTALITGSWANGSQTGGGNPINVENPRYTETLISYLRSIAVNGMVCTFAYGVRILPYKCVVSQLTIKDVRRAPSGRVISATASIQLTEFVEYNPASTILPGVELPNAEVPGVPSGGGGGGGNPPDDEDPDDPLVDLNRPDWPISVLNFTGRTSDDRTLFPLKFRGVDVLVDNPGGGDAITTVVSSDKILDVLPIGLI